MTVAKAIATLPTLKAWLLVHSEHDGVSASAVRSRFDKGRYPKAHLIYLNARVIYVNEK